MDSREPQVIINEQYTELIRKFKPQFGNEKHIEIARSLQEIGKLEKQLTQKRNAALGIEALEKRIEHLKSQALYLLKAYSQ